MVESKVTRPHLLLRETARITIRSLIPVDRLTLTLTLPISLPLSI